MFLKKGVPAHQAPHLTYPWVPLLLQNPEIVSSLCVPLRSKNKVYYEAYESKPDKANGHFFFAPYNFHLQSANSVRNSSFACGFKTRSTSFNATLTQHWQFPGGFTSPFWSSRLWYIAFGLSISIYTTFGNPHPLSIAAALSRSCADDSIIHISVRFLWKYYSHLFQSADTLLRAFLVFLTKRNPIFF